MNYQVTNPVTGEQDRLYPQASTESLGQMIGAADLAYRGWGRKSAVGERADLLRRVAAQYREQRDDLAAIAVKEVGKPVAQALDEVDFSADIYEYYADNAELFLRDEAIVSRSMAGRAVVRKEPIGALLGIMPWNYPYYQVARFAAPNLLLGNTVLLKPAPQCPESASRIGTLFHEAGLPAGAYATMFASNDQVAAVIADPRVRGVSLTGSERAGAAVAEVAGRHLKKVVLELGGSDPFIVLSTDDLDEVVRCAVRARVENNGQACNAAKRFIVLDHLYDDFLERFSRALRALVPGDPMDAGTFLGPVSSGGAAERLQQQVDSALDHGARAVVGGARTGAFFPVTLLTGITPDNPAYAEEFFGPVGAVYRASTEQEAIRLANDTDFGLGSYVFTTDPEQARRVAEQLEAGMVFINGVAADAPELPFGGVKRSGFGRELGRWGVEEFCNRKLIRTLA